MASFKEKVASVAVEQAVKYARISRETLREFSIS